MHENFIVDVQGQVETGKFRCVEIAKGTVTYDLELFNRFTVWSSLFLVKNVDLENNAYLDTIFFYRL